MHNSTINADNLTNNFKKVRKNNFENQFDSGSYIRWDNDLSLLQSSEIEKGDDQLSFVMRQWYNSYNSIETGRSDGERILDGMEFVPSKKEPTEKEKTFRSEKIALHRS